MNLKEYLPPLNQIFKDILENDNIKLSLKTGAKDIPEWDSLNHIRLVVAIEKHFKIRFKSADILRWQTVEEMCKSLDILVNERT